MPEEKDDLKLAYETLAKKRAEYDFLWQYYDGGHPLIYSTKRLKEIFVNVNAHFEQNWVGVVVNSAFDRINLEQWSHADKSIAERVADIWARTELNLDSDDVHLAAIALGESFIIAQRGDDGPEAYYNDPRQVHVFYDPDNPREKRLAAKMWVADDKRIRLNLYYPGKVVKYETKRDAKEVQTHNSFHLSGEDELSFQEIPVFHFRRERRRILGEVAGIIYPQNALNKLLNDMMIAAEFGAMRQRFIVSNAENMRFSSSPGVVWEIPARADEDGEDTQVGTFDATDIRQYLIAIDQLAESIAIVSRTPKHYIFRQGGTPSGEALSAMEAPLVHKVSRYIERFTPVWKHFMSFMLSLDGVTVDPFSLMPRFDDPETIQPRTQAEIREMGTRVGIPLTTMLRREGWTDAEISQMKSDRKDEDSERASDIADLLVQRERNFNGQR